VSDTWQRELVVMQLLAARAQIDATLTALGVNIADGSDTEPPCAHPKDKRENYTTFGGPEHWKCTLCGYTWDESIGTTTTTS
jgi:transposase-like protein